MKKLWMNYGLSGVPHRETSGTYDLTDIVPPIEPCLEDNLDDIESPTACFTSTGKILSFKDTVLSPFYYDQQCCVIWYEDPNGKIYFVSGKTIGYCADSKAEFVTRMKIESSLWFKTHKAFGSSIIKQMFRELGRPREGDDRIMDSAWLKEHKDEFTEEERAYLQYYIDHA